MREQDSECQRCEDGCEACDPRFVEPSAPVYVQEPSEVRGTVYESTHPLAGAVVEMKALNAEGLEKQMRVFESGATRNVEVDPDYHGFLSPLALHAYGEYMHRHRLQADGTMRDSDNWQKGIPNDAFVRSLVRHVHDIQLIHDGFGEYARQDDRDDNPLLAHLCAALFNVQGLLFNVMRANLESERDMEELVAEVRKAIYDDEGTGGLA